MSKFIKSNNYVQAHPCRLEPIDVDAFFINNEVDEDKTQIKEEETVEETQTESNVVKEEELKSENESNEIPAEKPEELESARFGEEGSGGIVEEQVTTKPEGFDLKRFANFAEQIGALIDGINPQDGTSAGGVKDISSTLFKPNKEENKQDTADLKDEKKQEPESFLSKLKREAADLTEEKKQESVPAFSKRPYSPEPEQGTRREAEKSFFEAKNAVQDLTEGIKTQEDILIEVTGKKGWDLAESAKKQESSILDGAKQKAGEITNDANRQADKVINEAIQQAEAIIEGAKQKGDKLIQRSNDQADEIIQNAKLQEEELIKAAKGEGEKLLASAREQSVAIKEKARVDGLQTGRQEGTAQIRNELEKNLTTALSLVMQGEQERENRIAASEPELLKLAVYIAGKIIGDEIKLDANRQIDIIKEALSRVSNATNIIIRLHPDDYQLVNENIPSLQEVFSEPKPVKLKEDPSILTGSCFIETDHGNIDARIISQLDMIMAELLKAGRIK